MLDPIDARAWLDAHTNLETGVGVPARGGVGKRLLAVERERPLMELLGSPETEYPVIHITGTNGKTSVVRMTAALLEADPSLEAYPALRAAIERSSDEDARAFLDKS